MNSDRARWKQAVSSWLNIVCSLIISFLVYEQNTSHTLILSQLQYIQMGRFLHAQTHTHTQGCGQELGTSTVIAAKSSIPLPKKPCDRSFTQIQSSGRSHKCSATNMKTPPASQSHSADPAEINVARRGYKATHLPCSFHLFK